MHRYERNIQGFIPQDEWLDIGFDVNRPNDPIDGLFGDIKTDNLVAYWESIAAEYQIPVMAQFHGFDTESQTTFRIPIDTHNIEKGLVKVKINQSERMRALIRAGVRDDALYDYVINDGLRLADQVFTRSKVAKNELLSSGAVTIKENNLDLTVEYGVPTEQLEFTLDLDKEADIPTQLQNIVSYAEGIGVTITGMVTAKKNLTKMRSNSSVQIATGGVDAAGALVRRGTLEAYLNEEFGISTIITNDLTYGADYKIGEDGRPVVTTARYFPDNKVTFFAAINGNQLGTGLWGDPPEVDVARLLDVRQSGEFPFVYVSQWVENDPAVLWTKAAGLFMPVLYNPNSLFIATVKPESTDTDTDNDSSDDSGE